MSLRAELRGPTGRIWPAGHSLETPGVKYQLEESDTHGLLANGTRLPFYGIIRLLVRLHKVKTKEVFIVSQNNEDAILGMPFFMAHYCLIKFKHPVVEVDRKPLVCTDQTGKLLRNTIQVIKELVVPARTEVVVQCRLNTWNFCPLEIIERYPEGPPLATSLNDPGADGKVLVRCRNLNP